MQIILLILVGLLICTNALTAWLFFTKVTEMTNKFMVLRSTGTPQEAQVLWNAMKNKDPRDDFREEQEEIDSQSFLEAIEDPGMVDIIANAIK